MSPTEADEVVALMALYWPDQLLSERMRAQWGSVLAHADLETACTIIEEAGQAGRQQRMTDGEFFNTFRKRTAPPPPARPLPEGESRTPEQWIEYCFEQLGGRRERKPGRRSET